MGVGPVRLTDSPRPPFGGGEVFQLAPRLAEFLVGQHPFARNFRADRKHSRRGS